MIVKVGPEGSGKIKVTHPTGVDITIVMDGSTVGTKYLTENITRIKPGLTLTPAHSHKDIEEISYVLEGEGEVWVEGDVSTITKGDSILWPVNKKHTVRNTGKEPLVLLCFFSTPHYRKKGAYLTHADAPVAF